MSENKKVFFIVNKFSGTGYRDSVEGRIIATCVKAGLEPTIEFTRDRGHATELARDAVAGGFRRIFAVGGDGTVNEVAQSLVHTDASLGILPKGSGNGLARHLGIPMRFTTALSLITSERTLRIDTLLVNDRLSVNVSGIGFDGHVAAQFGKNSKRGLAGYAKLVLKEFRSFNEFTGRVILDGHEVALKGFIVAIANSSQFGNNARVAPLASVCDEHMDVSVIRKVSLLKAVGLVNRLFAGTISKSRQVTIKRARHSEIFLDRAVEHHIDGEPRGEANMFRIEVVPASLSVILPDNGSKRNI